MFTSHATGEAPVIPDGWEMLIADFVAYLAAIGRPATTIALRRGQLEHLARSVAVAPTLVTLDLGRPGAPRRHSGRLTQKSPPPG